MLNLAVGGMTRRDKVATKAEVEFVKGIANPTAVLTAITQGHTAVAAAAGNEAALEDAIIGTWLEIAELEGEETAETIISNVWPVETAVILRSDAMEHL